MFLKNIKFWKIKISIEQKKQKNVKFTDFFEKSLKNQ